MVRLIPKYIKGIILLITLLCSSVAISGTMGAPLKGNQWVLSLSAGPAWARGGETQTFYLAPDIEKTYFARKTSNSLPEGEVFLGLQKDWLNTLQAQFGLAIATTGNANISGDIWDDADPQFNNYVYNYKIRHTHVAVKGKLLGNQSYMVTPWISGSIGIGFNYANNYINIPTIFEAVMNPNFSSYTKTAFTYTLGIGVQKVLNDKWQVGIGYEFTDWGKSQLGRAPGQTFNSGLKLDHLYTNGALLNVTYVV